MADATFRFSSFNPISFTQFSAPILQSNARETIFKSFMASSAEVMESHVVIASAKLYANLDAVLERAHEQIARHRRPGRSEVGYPVLRSPISQFRQARAFLRRDPHGSMFRRQRAG